MTRARTVYGTGPLILTVLLGLPLALACGGGADGGREARHLNVYIWANYLPAAVVSDFERRTGIRVEIDTYSSNEALLEKLQSGVADYDLVVPSDYMLQVLVSQHLLRPLDRRRLPGFANLEARLLDHKFDPGNRFSLPYLWGTTGIGYDRLKVSGPVDSWRALFDPRYAGRILMLDDMREAFGAALRLDGRSINERDPAALRRAAARLHRGPPARHVPRRRPRLRPAPRPGRRTSRVPPSPRRPARIRLHRLQHHRRPERHRRPRSFEHRMPLSLTGGCRAASPDK